MSGTMAGSQGSTNIGAPGSSSNKITEARETGKEPISCKSCRQKKIRCSRTRPSCQSCQVYSCPCIYDAVPRKKGPNNEILKQMLQRIDGLEKRLAEKDRLENRSSLPITDNQDEIGRFAETPAVTDGAEVQLQSPSSSISDSQDWEVLDAFFQNFNGNPYSFLHEATTRQQLNNNKLPSHLLNAIHAISVRYLEKDDKLRDMKCEKFMNLARQQLDVDDPSLPNIQTALLLSLANFSLGRGKPCWMQLGVAIRMAQALHLQRELPDKAKESPLERELARRIFWTCYIMDRLNVVGSKRPYSVADETISLRMPCQESSFRRGTPEVAPLFQRCTTRYCVPFESTGAMFVDVTRIMGKAIQYLQQGGVKGDSHFPWHHQSTLSQIRDELTVWASRTSGVESASSFTDPDIATTNFLTRCIYHQIYILIYRPFLPFTLSEPGIELESMHKAWHSEAINLSIQHATFILDLKRSKSKNHNIRTPPYFSYCLTSAATVFIHTLYYTDHDTYINRQQLLELFEGLNDMKYVWKCVNFQCSVLHSVFDVHSKLISQYKSDGVYPSSMHLDDIFDRYPTMNFELSYIPFQAPDDWPSVNYTNLDDELVGETLLSCLNRGQGKDSDTSNPVTHESYISSLLSPNATTISGQNTERDFQGLDTLSNNLFDSFDWVMHCNESSQPGLLFDINTLETSSRMPDPLMQMLGNLAANNTDIDDCHDFGHVLPTSPST